jgi:anti-sigma B factor antagonist
MMMSAGVSGSGDLPGAVAHDAALSSESGKLKVALITDNPRTVEVMVAGELDLTTMPVLDRHLAGIDLTQLTRLVIDLRRVTFMDSTGACAMLRAHRSAESNGHTVVFRRGPRKVQQLFELTGINDCLIFEDD